MAEVDTHLAILIAEDDPNLGDALRGFLRERGYRVTLARDGSEALACLAQEKFFLVITDLIMPGADGLTVLRAARQLDPPPLVLLMTGYASIDSAIQAIREGASDYLRKPFKLQEIDIAVAKAAQLRALYQENQALLTKLEDLSAQLATLVREEAAGQPKAAAPPSSQVLRPAGEFQSLGPLQGDLDRLRLLYQERLLSEHEYHALKQRLLV